MASLSAQRQWVKAYTEKIVCSTRRVQNSRRKCTILYYLPDEEAHKVPVCMSMFLRTLDFTQKQVRTIVAKTDENGVLEGEKRGGRVCSLSEDDRVRNEKIKAHIAKFPRAESYYCRRNSNKEYLSPELNVSQMHKMFVKENPGAPCSYTTYLRVFKCMNLSFLSPKKDMCGICSTYHETKDGDE